jgi:N-acetylneuraminic acid mutarotase
MTGVDLGRHGGVEAAGDKVVGTQTTRRGSRPRRWRLSWPTRDAEVVNVSKPRLALLALVGVAVLLLAAGAAWAVVPDLPGQWQTRPPSGPERQEVSYVRAGGGFYLAGGYIPGSGRTNAHERYDPQTNSWQPVAPLPAALDHVQGVRLGGKIYYIGGLLAQATQSNAVYVYDTATDSFSRGTPMPAGRGRGAGGVAVYNGRIYYAGGLHDGKAVPWFDRYNPATGKWTRLPNMPRPRDHFQGAVVDGRFYAIGGRDTTIDATTRRVDVYNLSASAGGVWRTRDTALPTARAGFATAVLGRKILVVGGEGSGKAYDTVEAYYTATNSWRTLEPMPTARHGIQAIVCNGGVYIAAGGTVQGGTNPTDAHEVFFPGGATSCGGTSASR